MADNVKVNISERNGVELDFTEELELNAQNIPYDNTASELLATDVQEGIDELATSVATSASPGFSWGRAGNNSNTWLQNEGVPSNKAGRAITFTDPRIVRIFTATEDAATYTLEIYEHEGNSINLTLLTSLSVTSSRTGDSGAIEIAATEGRQLAILLSSGSAKNIVVGLQLSGSNA